MNNKKGKTRLKSYFKLIQSGLSLLVCNAVILYAVFAWFQTNPIVTASNASANVVGSTTLKVSKTSGGVDIGELVAPDNLVSVTINDGNTRLYPGVSGSFKLYITATGSDNQIYINILPSILAGGINTDGSEASKYREGYYNSYGEEVALAALNYTKGHILFFLGCDANGVYSDWLNPYEGTSLTLDNHTETEVNIYWIWVDYYYKLCDGSRLIAAEDITSIRSWYFTNPGFTDKAAVNLFDTKGVALNANTSQTKLNHYYDFADGDIGSLIQHIYFRLNFTANR